MIDLEEVTRFHEAEQKAIRAMEDADYCLKMLRESGASYRMIEDFTGVHHQTLKSRVEGIPGKQRHKVAWTYIKKEENARV